MRTEVTKTDGFHDYCELRVTLLLFQVPVRVWVESSQILHLAGLLVKIGTLQRIEEGVEKFPSIGGGDKKEDF